jgi:hypothetical protein
MSLSRLSSWLRGIGLFIQNARPATITGRKRKHRYELATPPTVRTGTDLQRRREATRLDSAPKCRAVDGCAFAADNPAGRNLIHKIVSSL